MAGRFAPSPTGPLHLGSLATALASYLDAKAHGLRWWLRMEDLDPPREPPGAAETILAQLSDHGLRWDVWPAARGGRVNGVLYQSDRAQRPLLSPGDSPGEHTASDPRSAYAEALDRLIAAHQAFRCRCSRSQLAGLAAAQGIAFTEDGEALYPGRCRPPAPAVAPQERHAWRFFDPTAPQQDNFVMKRADGFWAYHLAVVVDDAFQGVARIVRGADLASALPRHRALQRALGLLEPVVVHVPVVVNALGQKLSKQTRAPALGGTLAEIRKQRQSAWNHLLAQMPADWLAKVTPTAEAFLA